MRILVSGGTGYIGGRLAVHLSRAGHQIVLGSRKLLGSPEWLPGAKMVQTKWNDTEELTRSCHGVDVVVHAAGMNAQDCLADPVAALNFNGVATARFVEAAARADVKCFLYLSTAHVYGSPLIGIVSEENCPKNLHPYATSHLTGEQVVLAANERHEIQGAVLRLSNVFGAPVEKGVNCWTLLVNDLCRQAVQSRRLTLRSSGKQQRDFIAMKDVVQIVEQLFHHVNVGRIEGVFNLGSGVTDTALSMAHLVQRRCLSVLAYEPIMQIGFDTELEEVPDFKYKSTRLASFGISTNYSDINRIDEIDKLIAFCRDAFDS